MCCPFSVYYITNKHKMNATDVIDTRHVLFTSAFGKYECQYLVVNFYLNTCLVVVYFCT